MGPERGQDPTVLVFGVFRSNPIVGTMDGSLYLFDSNRQLSRVVDAHKWPGDGEVFVQRRFDHGGARTGK